MVIRTNDLKLLANIRFNHESDKYVTLRSSFLKGDHMHFVVVYYATGRFACRVKLPCNLRQVIL